MLATGAASVGKGAHNHEKRNRASPSPARSRVQLTLELGKTAQHRQYQPAVRRRRIRPSILEGFEAGTLLAEAVED